MKPVEYDVGNDAMRSHEMILVDGSFNIVIVPWPQTSLGLDNVSEWWVSVSGHNQAWTF